VSSESAAKSLLQEPHSASETLLLVPLFTGAQLSVHDVRCRPHDFSPGREESSRLHQVVFPRRGVFERRLRGRRLIADPTQVLFFGKDEAYQVAHPAGCGDDCTAFSFTDVLLRDALASVDPRQSERSAISFRVDHARSDAALVLAHERLRASLTARRDTLAVEETALGVLSAALDCAYRTCTAAATSETARSHRQKMQETALFLASHFREEHSLDQIARAVHCSAFHLARLFRAHAGLSIHQYRHQLRLREALRRIAEGESNLTSLALSLGFASHSHLTDSFKRTFGSAPRGLRAELLARRLGALTRDSAGGHRT
jgi:AraC family transcriptional regulator